MSEPTDVEREQEIRAEHERADGTHAGRMFNPERDFLLRLLDAERARADAAEAKVAPIEFERAEARRETCGGYLGRGLDCIADADHDGPCWDQPINRASLH